MHKNTLKIRWSYQAKGNEKMKLFARPPRFARFDVNLGVQDSWWRHGFQPFSPEIVPAARSFPTWPAFVFKKEKKTVKSKILRVMWYVRRRWWFVQDKHYDSLRWLIVSLMWVRIESPCMRHRLYRLCNTLCYFSLRSCDASPTSYSGEKLCPETDRKVAAGRQDPLSPNMPVQSSWCDGPDASDDESPARVKKKRAKGICFNTAIIISSSISSSIIYYDY